MRLRRSLSPWLLGGASLTFGAVLALAAVEPVFGAADTYAQVDPAAVQQGMTVIEQHRCGGCHIIPGIPNANGNLGPDLSAHGDVPPVSDRGMIATYPNGAVPNNSPDDMAAWLVNPNALKPGTAMPNLGLSQDDANAAAAYMYAIQADGSVAGIDDSSAPAPDDSGGDGG
ncbi:MAG TPA: c-type cytochrome [Chloroflexota bacterium]